MLFKGSSCGRDNRCSCCIIVQGAMSNPTCTRVHEWTQSECEANKQVACAEGNPIGVGERNREMLRLEARIPHPDPSWAPFLTTATRRPVFSEARIYNF